MLVDNLTPKPDAKVEFNYSELSSVPVASGCYIITTYDGTILYIGQSKNIHNRMDTHLGDKEKRSKTPMGIAYWFYYKLYPVLALDNLEGGWINEHKIREGGNRPYFNKKDAHA